MPLRTDPGQLGGDAIVNTLFGDNNPGALATFDRALSDCAVDSAKCVVHVM